MVYNNYDVKSSPKLKLLRHVKNSPKSLSEIASC